MSIAEKPRGRLCPIQDVAGPKCERVECHKSAQCTTLAQRFVARVHFCRAASRAEGFESSITRIMKNAINEVEAKESAGTLDVTPNDFVNFVFRLVRGS